MYIVESFVSFLRVDVGTYRAGLGLGARGGMRWVGAGSDECVCIGLWVGVDVGGDDGPGQHRQCAPRYRRHVAGPKSEHVS